MLKTPRGTVEAWGRSAKNPVNGWYGLKKGLRGRFGAKGVFPIESRTGSGATTGRRHEPQSE